MEVLLKYYCPAIVLAWALRGIICLSFGTHSQSMVAMEAKVYMFLLGISAHRDLPIQSA